MSSICICLKKELSDTLFPGELVDLILLADEIIFVRANFVKNYTVKTIKYKRKSSRPNEEMFAKSLKRSLPP